MSLDRQPRLIGAGVTLRPLRPEDREPLYEVARDPLIWEQHPSPDRHERARFEAFFDAALRSGGALAILDASGRMIGTSRFDGHDPAASEVEIGWTFLSREHWGRGTNQEIKRLMIDHAFASVERILFVVGPENLRSRRAVEKLGARLVGEREDSAGEERVVYELTRPPDSTSGHGFTVS